MRVALLFTDGVGIGTFDVTRNPLTHHPWLLSQFDDAEGTQLPHGGVLCRVDTTFGVAGRPQSATNQTALYTGVDAPRLVGAHVLGFPTAALKALLAEHSIARRMSASHRAVFVNAYPVEYLAALGLPHRPSGSKDIELPTRMQRKLKASASTLAMAAGRVDFRTFADARAHRALTNDIDGTRAAARGLEVPTRTMREAAQVFWSNAGDFTLFEHFLADEAGHEQNFELATAALSGFDEFAREVIALRPLTPACSSPAIMATLKTS